MIKPLSFRFKLEPFALAMVSVEARRTRLPLGLRVSDAPSLSVRLATVALALRVTDLPPMTTRSSAAGTPRGLQLGAVDHLPPLAGPTQVLVAGVSRMAW